MLSENLQNNYSHLELYRFPFFATGPKIKICWTVLWSFLNFDYTIHAQNKTMVIVIIRNVYRSGYLQLLCRTHSPTGHRGCILFHGLGRPGQAQLFFFDNRPGPAMLASVLFHRPGGPGRPKVGLAVDFGRYRPRPRPALFVFANGIGKRCAR